MFISSTDIDLLSEHQLLPDGLSCACHQSSYTIPAPYKQTLREHAQHQMQVIAHLLYRRRAWDD